MSGRIPLIFCAFIFSLINFFECKPLNNNSKRSPYFNRTLLETRILSNPNRRVTFQHNINQEQDIIFPDSSEVMYEHIPRIDGSPKCAKGLTFCETVDSYPYNKIKEVLKENKVSTYLFGEDEPPNEIANRIGDDDQERFVCRSHRKTVFPQVAKDKNQQWRYIVNQGDDGYVQGILIETCANLNGNCEILGSLPEGYSTSCKQKYVYRRLYSINSDGKLEPETFQIPSACCCAYKADTSFLLRFGRQMSPAVR